MERDKALNLLLEHIKKVDLDTFFDDWRGGFNAGFKSAIYLALGDVKNGLDTGFVDLMYEIDDVELKKWLQSQLD